MICFLLGGMTDWPIICMKERPSIIVCDAFPGDSNRDADTGLTPGSNGLHFTHAADY